MHRELVDRIWTRMLVRYSGKWLRMWEGLGDEVVKADWQEVLQGVTEAGVWYAMSHLPADVPPNAMQFRALCLGKPEAPAPALPAPKADPERVKEVLGSIKVSRNAYSKEWAHRLKREEESGARLTLAQRAAWRSALGKQSQEGEQP